MRLLILFLIPSLAFATTYSSATASRADVQAAVDLATDGDTVSIPNGTATWTSGITTTKQIIIRATNYTPTSGGAASRNVVITNNSTTGLFSFTTGNSFNCGLAGIQFLNGTGTGSMIATAGTGSKVALINDVTLEISGKYAPDSQQIVWDSQGGVLWNMYMVGQGGTVDGNGWVIKSPRSWTTASTMGMLDTAGTVNTYLEDSTILGAAAIPDVDDGGRFVMRYCSMDGVWGSNHGFTSATGGRHAEYYNNTFSNTVSGRNIAARYYWLRGGTILFTDNVVNNAAFPSEYGAPYLLDIGDTTTPTTYPQARQPGWGHDGASSVIDPIYVWNNTGARGSMTGVETAWQTNVQYNRDIFVDAGAKPGWSKYTYPHPLRTDAGSTTGGSSLAGKITITGKATIR